MSDTPARTSLEEDLGTYYYSMDDVWEELERVETKFPGQRFTSSHQGWAVLAEELDELWEVVKRRDKERARTEAAQIAAMAMKFLRDIDHMEWC